MYETSAEAYELAKKLLKDTPLRQAIVQACQKWVEENSRWSHRFAEMESILSVPMLRRDPEKKEGTVIFLDPHHYKQWVAPTYWGYIAKSWHRKVKSKRKKLRFSNRKC